MRTFKQFIPQTPKKNLRRKPKILPPDYEQASKNMIMPTMPSYSSTFVEHTEVPFEHNPKLGWWGDHEHVTLYHGTHKKNIESVYKHGISHKDPRTGKISLALEPHTAHGYASMSNAGGEHHYLNFREHGGKPVHTPDKDRVVFKLRVPKHWLHKHMDHNYGGNIGKAAEHIRSKEAYHKAASHPDHADFHHYQMAEFRVGEHVPKEFIVGHMHKAK